MRLEKNKLNFKSSYAVAKNLREKIEIVVTFQKSNLYLENFSKGLEIKK